LRDGEVAQDADLAEIEVADRLEAGQFAGAGQSTHKLLPAGPGAAASEP